MKLVGGFGLYHKLLINDHVQSLFRELVPLVKDRYGDLTRHTVFTLDQLPLEAIT